ncbi:unnamed protein product [Lymnaea stagnalis]|uniref:Uncharacterized protein n=1 Tax=Lymnaea stagnalis TaxID=6523 RepID=A0AAV2HBW4_LYMST
MFLQLSKKTVMRLSCCVLVVMIFSMSYIAYSGRFLVPVPAKAKNNLQDDWPRKVSQHLGANNEKKTTAVKSLKPHLDTPVGNPGDPTTVESPGSSSKVGSAPKFDFKVFRQENKSFKDESLILGRQDTVLKSPIKNSHNGQESGPQSDLMLNTTRASHYLNSSKSLSSDISEIRPVDARNNVSLITELPIESLDSIHETLPTIHYNFTIPKTNFTRSPRRSSHEVKTVTLKPLILPPPPQVETTSNSNHTKYLVYLCDSRSMCGGWGDRQRGIVAVYVLAWFTNRQFKLVMTSPCDLSSFYVPNKVKWQPDPKELDPPSDHNTINNYGREREMLYKNISSGDFNEHLPQRTLYMKTNSDVFSHYRYNPAYASLLKTWTGLQDERTRFRWAWSNLMQPAPPMLSKLQGILGPGFLERKGLLHGSSTRNMSKSPHDVGGAHLVCAHVRIGQNPSLPMDGPFTAVELKDIPTLHKFMLSKDLRGDARFFVATDFINVRIRSHNYFGNRFVEHGGKITHIDRQRRGDDVCGGFETVLIDQLILSLCDVLIVSKSGFSIRASFMRDSSEQVYILENGDIYEFTP